MKVKPYPKTKPSGIEWLGDIPAHWEVKRLKMAAQLEDCKVEADEENPMPYIGMENIESWTGRLLPINPDVVPMGTANSFKAGHTLFGKLRPYLAKACNPEFDGICSTELLVLNGVQFDRDSLLYAMLSDGFVKLVDSSTYGSKMPRASWDFIGNCGLPLPPLSEQKAIAEFLDRETGRIDVLVEKKRTLIERLKEKRSALISACVTRGLPAGAGKKYPRIVQIYAEELQKSNQPRPSAFPADQLPENPPLNPSGIEWLGNIPEHWEVKRSRFVLRVNPSSSVLRTLDECEEVSFVPMDSVGVEGGINLEQSRVIGDVSTGYTEFQNNDVVVAKITPCFENGKAALAENLLNGAAYGTTELHVLRAQESIDRRFLFLVVISDIFRKNGESEMYGAGGQKRVPPEFIKDFLIPLPPLPEQRAIAAYLDEETAIIDALVAKVETAIERLREYRSALITAAVTGKIDVRKAAGLSIEGRDRQKIEV